MNEEMERGRLLPRSCLEVQECHLGVQSQDYRTNNKKATKRKSGAKSDAVHARSGVYSPSVAKQLEPSRGFAFLTPLARRMKCSFN